MTLPSSEKIPRMALGHPVTAGGIAAAVMVSQVRQRIADGYDEGLA